MDRPDWQALAEERILAAQALLSAGQWASAYYLAGYAVEFGLKSCVLVRVAKHPKLIFEERRFSEKCWSHSVQDLIELAGLKDQRDADIVANPALEANWLLVTAWNEKSRYAKKVQAEAEALFSAITDRTNGVMQWIRIHW